MCNDFKEIVISFFRLNTLAWAICAASVVPTHASVIDVSFETFVEFADWEFAATPPVSPPFVSGDDISLSFSLDTDQTGRDALANEFFTVSSTRGGVPFDITRRVFDVTGFSISIGALPIQNLSARLITENLVFPIDTPGNVLSDSRQSTNLLVLADGLSIALEIGSQSSTSNIPFDFDIEGVFQSLGSADTPFLDIVVDGSAFGLTAADCFADPCLAIGSEAPISVSGLDTPTAVPLPASLPLLGMGAFAVFGLRRAGS